MREARWLNNISIYRKLLFIAVAGAVLPMVVMLGIYTYRSNLDYREREVLIEEALVSNVTTDVRVMFGEMARLALQYTGAESYNDALDVRSGMEEDLRTRTLSRMDDSIDRDLLATQQFSQIKVYTTSENLPYISDNFYTPEEFDTNIWHDASGKIPSYMFITTEITEGEVTLGVAKTVNSTFYDSQEVFHVTMDGDTVNRIMREGKLGTYDGEVYLVDVEDRVIAGSGLVYTRSDNEFVDYATLDLTQASEIITVDVDEQLYLKGWRLVFVTVGDSARDAFMIQLLGILFGAVAIIIVVFLSHFFLTNSIVNRLQIINNSMEMAEQEKFVTIEDFLGHDEIGQTASHFNQMIRRIHGFVYDDMLTGMMNRQAITELLNKAVARADRMNTLGVMFLDVDNFKFINDTYGHDLGDEVIKATAKRIRSVSDSHIHVGRFGGDEFIIVVEKCGVHRDLDSIGNNIRSAFVEPIHIQELTFFLTVSIGVAVCPTNGTTTGELIKKADLALYEAKEGGKNRLVYYNQAMDDELEAKVTFQNRVKDAFKKRKFTLNYQPYFNEDGTKLMAFEALIRWYSDDYGYVSPFKLIQTVESMGLIVEVGQWVMEEAMAFEAWVKTKGKEDVVISINISIAQLVQPGFFEQTMALVEKYGLKPSDVVLEMTETVLIESIEQSSELVRRLRDAGFGIAIDDFGTGYSSLSYLQSLPVSQLKIDRSFIKDIVEVDTTRDLVKIIADIAHRLGMSVVAEGVEEPSQLVSAKGAGCDYIQGFLLGRPLDIDDALRVAEAHGRKDES